MTATRSAISWRRGDRLDVTAFLLLLGSAVALQFSIAAGEALLALAALAWAGLLVTRRERVAVPPVFWPLAAYAGLTLVSALFSRDPLASLSASKELLLFLTVPIVYRLCRGERAPQAVDVIVTAGAVSAIIGIVQYGVLHYDHLGRRPQGALTHYMTYSGVLMLVVTAATARLLFRREGRIWPSLVMPALLVALALTFTRSAWVGACAGIGLLLVLKDFRLLALLPVAAAVFIGLAPERITARVYSMFDLNDPTNRDRVAMLRSGARMVRDHPLTGVGPDMVKVVYADYRDAAAVEPLTLHLHNVPMQIAAERGLVALGVWVWFLVRLVVDLVRRLRLPSARALAAGSLAALAAMLAAGMFEYNFGDSEFLVLLLVLVTLPFAALGREPDRPA